jgi:hypothetical protein
VNLWHGGVRKAGAITDDFGGFRFGGLSKDSGNYRIEVRHGQSATQHECTFGKSVYLGELMLPRYQSRRSLQ